MTTTISGTAGVTFPAGGVGNPAGAVVGTTDTQTLTNKTLTSPTITGAVVSSMGSSVITSGTAVTSTSGTSVDFTGLPTWVKRVTLSFSGLSTNGTSPIRIQIGPVGGISATGYAGSGSAISTASAAAVGTSTAGFDFNDANSAAASRHGSFVLTLIDSSTNLWAASSVFGLGNQSLTGFFGGAKTLTGALSILRVTTVNGTDTFDAGSINILYE